MQLHPDFPVVSGTYRLTPDWTIDLPFEMNRRIEDSDLVLWRPGFTVWLAVWGNDHEERESERILRIYSDLSPQATDIHYQPDQSPARLSYRLHETQDGGAVFALYGFVVSETGHLQIAFYCDSEADLKHADKAFAGVSYAAA